MTIKRNPEEFLRNFTPKEPTGNVKRRILDAAAEEKRATCLMTPGLWAAVAASVILMICSLVFDRDVLPFRGKNSALSFKKLEAVSYINDTVNIFENELLIDSVSIKLIGQRLLSGVHRNKAVSIFDLYRSMKKREDFDEF